MVEGRKLLEVLKAELAFLEEGGYRARPPYPWRPNFVFEDSPTCINFKNPDERRPCTECPLIDFVPEDRREARYPCRHILLTTRGETVNSFYEWGTEEELEATLWEWLRQAIRELEMGEKSQAPGRRISSFLLEQIGASLSAKNLRPSLSAEPLNPCARAYPTRDSAWSLHEPRAQR